MGGLIVGENAAIIGLAVEIAVLLVGAVWAISSIKSTTARLGVHIESLASAIRRLDHNAVRQETRMNEHDQRIARIEGKIQE